MSKRFLRIVPIAGVLTALSLVFASSAVAGGGGGGGGAPLPPGNYTFKNTSAFTQYQIIPSGGDCCTQFVSVTAGRGLNTSRPPGGPTVVTHQTTLNLFVQGGITSVIEQGCWVIPESNFVVAANLHSASLDTQITDQTPPCPGVTILFPTPVNVHVTWTWNGLIGTSKKEGSFTCDGRSTRTESTTKGAVSTSNGSISGIGAGLSDGAAFVSQLQSEAHVKGQLPSNCAEI